MRSLKNNYLDIGITLRKYRDQNKNTQQYVADFLGISRISYRKWENNEIDFTISQLQKISSLYDVEIEEIIAQSCLSKKRRLIKEKKYPITSAP